MALSHESMDAPSRKETSTLDVRAIAALTSFLTFIRNRPFSLYRSQRENDLFAMNLLRRRLDPDSKLPVTDIEYF